MFRVQATGRTLAQARVTSVELTGPSNPSVPVKITLPGAVLEKETRNSVGEDSSTFVLIGG